MAERQIVGGMVFLLSRGMTDFCCFRFILFVLDNISPILLTMA